jgi:uncharacterized membrane protein
VALVLVACLGYKLFYKREAVQSFDGWVLSFGGLGALIVLLGGYMTLALTIPAPNVFKNVLFGGTALAFGVLLLMAATYLARRGEKLASMMQGGKDKKEEAITHMLHVCRPASWFVFAIGLALASVAVGALQHNIFGGAPPQEPLLGTAPSGLVNFYITASLYILPAIGALLAPLAVYTQSRKVMAIVGTAWFLGGVGTLLLGAFVFYAHIAMEYNFRALSR